MVVDILLSKKHIYKMKRVNCWEHMKCGREVGGARAEELGICPASLSGEHDGTNKGRSRGRICWAVEGVNCNGNAADGKASTLAACLECEFLNRVHNEESRHFVLTPIHHIQFSLKEH